MRKERIKSIVVFKTSNALIGYSMANIRLLKTIDISLWQIIYFYGIMRLLVFILFFLRVMQLKAQQPSYIHFNSQNGLPGNTVYYSYQDRNGYIWLSTDKGVARYNGYGFTIFNANNGLSDHMIFDIFQDSKDRIWFACQNGELCYYQNGKFFNKSNSTLLSKIRTNSTGLKVFENSKKELFYLTQRFLVKMIDDSVLVTELKEDKAYSTMIRNNKGDVLSLSYDKTAIHIHNVANQTGIQFSHGEKEVMPRLNTKADWIDSSYIFSSNRSLVRIPEEGGDYTILHKYDHMIQFIRKYDKSRIWVGTQKGLYVFNTGTNKNEKQWFKENSISCSMKDREGNIWVTSLDNGVFLILNDRSGLMNASEGLTFTNTNRVIDLDSNTTLIGSDYFRFAIIQGNEIKNFSLPQREGNGLIRNARKDRNGNIYVFTAVNIMKLNKNFENIKTYEAAIRDIYFDSFDSVYIARTNGVAKIHVSLFDQIGNDLDAFLHSSVRLRHNVSFLFVDEKERVWAVGGNEVIPFNKSPSLILKDDPLFSVNINDMTGAFEKTIYISSGINGIKVVNKSKVHYINTSNGLASNFVTSLCLDEKEDLWASTSLGVSLIKIEEQAGEIKFNVKNYSFVHGLPQSSVSDVIYKKGKIWASTVSGLCIIDPNDLNKENPLPTLLVEKILFKDSLMDATRRNFKIPYQFNDLRIEYLALSVGAQGNLKYKYSMKGLQDGQSETNDLKLHYPSLAPGSYTLELSAINEAGRSSKPVQLFIEIIPEWYQTSIFRGIVLLFLVFTITLIIYFRNRSWKRSQQLKESLLLTENKRLELEQKALRLHMNPHFIFNAINAIDGFYAQGENDAGKRYINRFSKILRTLLDHSSHKLISLQKEVELLINYLELNKLRFPDKFNYRINIDRNLDVENIAIPPMILQPFVENSIIHGIAPLKKEGLIEINMSAKGAYLFCEVKDNGIGLQRSRVINKDRIHKSTGIQVSIERIKANCKNKEDNYKIEEYTDSLGNIAGTCVHFQIDLQTLH